MTEAICMHLDVEESVCRSCGQCIHDVVLNGACFYCGTTDLDPEKMSPKKSAPSLIPVSRLTRDK
jgi:hypothetical protein